LLNKYFILFIYEEKLKTCSMGWWSSFIGCF